MREEESGERRACAHALSAPRSRPVRRQPRSARWPPVLVRRPRGELHAAVAGHEINIKIRFSLNSDLLKNIIRVLIISMHCVMVGARLRE